MNFGVVLGIMIAVAYVLLYLGGRVYNREGFAEETNGGRNCRTVLDTGLELNKPYVTYQDKYGDFEADFVYQNEGGYDPTQEAINMARRRFPFDWSQLPPSSSLFQAQQALFVKDPTTGAAPFTKETFQTIEGLKVLPPDKTAEEQAEEDALKAYQPKMAADMKAVDEQSVQQLIDNIYGSKGLIPKVVKKANNVFEVYEVQEKEPKIVYEDEIQSSMQSNALNPLVDPAEMLVVPNAASEISVGLAPYGRGERTAVDRQSYSQYNPNLEGIFGPKMQWQQWG